MPKPSDDPKLLRQASTPLPGDTTDAIDRRFREALAIIKRTRQFSLDPYQRKGGGLDELPLSVHSHMDRSRAASRGVRG